MSEPKKLWGDIASGEPSSKTDAVEAVSETIATLSVGSEVSASASEEYAAAPVETIDTSTVQKTVRDDESSLNPIEVFQSNPGCDLFSQDDFFDFKFPQWILDVVTDRNWAKPTLIQSLFMHRIINDNTDKQDMIVVAPTGSGKTSGFVLCMLSCINEDDTKPQVVCISPTFELADMTATWFEDMAKINPKIKVAKILREKNVTRNYQQCQVLICTPQSMVRICENDRRLLANVKLLVLDEADALLEKAEMFSQVQSIKRFIPGGRGKTQGKGSMLQTLLFSATFEEGVLKIAQGFTHHPAVIKCPGIPKLTQHFFLDISKTFKKSSGPIHPCTDVVSRIHEKLSGGLQTFIFAETKAECNNLATSLSQQGIPASPLHSDVENRAETVKALMEGKLKVVVATKVGARGIDISSVGLVIILGPPRTYVPQRRGGPPVKGPEDFISYLHMSGRTGRIGNVGAVVTLVREEDEKSCVLGIQHAIQNSVNEATELAQKQSGANVQSTPFIIYEFQV
eukprot:TRINITY_DN985_c0_g4_i2.p1 TRINITY_DN985_c0_g4~~TRINITY_DN985_c0_g4_i2.p1  ORF type:complete len:512 (-),score=101.95 TRINITY_DN985_c0_g4_i2:475-2010(-)